MATLSVESDSLRTNAEKIIKLAGRMNGIHNRFVRVRRTLDWDVMGEAQYLGTPHGMLYAYDGSNDTQRTVSSGMPKAAVEFPDCKTK